MLEFIAGGDVNIGKFFVKNSKFIAIKQGSIDSK